MAALSRYLFGGAGVLLGAPLYTLDIDLFELLHQAGDIA